MEQEARLIYPEVGEEATIAYATTGEQTAYALATLRRVQAMTQEHLIRSVRFILKRAKDARDAGIDAQRLYAIKTLDEFIAPRKKSDTSVLLASATRLVVYNQCAHLCDLYRDVPGHQMATEQPRVVVAYHRIRLEWILLGTILESALVSLTEDAPIEQWLRLGVRLRFLTEQLLADAAEKPRSATVDAATLLARLHVLYDDLRAHLHQFGTRLTPEQFRERSRFEQFALYLMSDARIDLKEWRPQAMRAERILTHDTEFLGKAGDEPTASDEDEDAMELEKKMDEEEEAEEEAITFEKKKE